ncbi:hypothetical protein J6590_034454 [Homalodisca vitripennis]|nr:hypothetical protein J6590_034454 [Homalodisca vitripennis]
MAVASEGWRLCVNGTMEAMMEVISPQLRYLASEGWRLCVNGTMETMMEVISPQLRYPV